jgi:hypothetical protein
MCKLVELFSDPAVVARAEFRMSGKHPKIPDGKSASCVTTHPLKKRGT